MKSFKRSKQKNESISWEKYEFICFKMIYVFHFKIHSILQIFVFLNSCILKNLLSECRLIRASNFSNWCMFSQKLNKDLNRIVIQMGIRVRVNSLKTFRYELRHNFQLNCSQSIYSLKTMLGAIMSLANF